MRDRFPGVVVGALLLAGATLAFLQRGAARGRFAQALSTYRSEPDGARALFLLASEAGLPVDRARTDLSFVGEDTAWVLLGAAARSGAEASLPDGGFDPDEQELREGLLSRDAPLRETERRALLAHVGQGRDLVYVPAKAQGDALLDALHVRLDAVSPDAGLRTLVPAQPSPYTLGVQRLETEVAAFLDVPANAVPLVVDASDLRIAAALVPWKQGRVLVLGTPELAMNKALARADNARFWMNALRTVAASGRVTFDEFHHGFTDDRSVAEFARHYQLHLAGLQLLFGLVLWGGSLRRFGRPRLPAEDQRVGAADALFAQSRLYREGGHHAHAAARLAQGLAEDLSARAGLSARAAPPELARALQARGRPDLASALLAVTRDASRAHSDAGVLRVARAVTRIRQRKDV